MKRILITFVMLGLIPGLYAYAPNTNEHVRFGTPSKIQGTLLKRKGFVVRYNAITKNPIWVSYHLTPEYLKKPLKAIYRFKPDPNIYPESNASVEDYAKSPYARCRMAPLDDMSRSKEVMAQCFYLTNVSPMDQALYKGAWKKLEKKIREFVLAGTDCWVVAGPVFEKESKGKPKTIGRNKVHVPQGFYKIVMYQGKDGSFKAAAFLFKNAKQKKALSEYLVPVAEIETLTGLTFFDKLPEHVGKIIKEKVYAGGELL